MRNYLKDLPISASASPKEVTDTLDRIAENANDFKPDHRSDAIAVLSDTKRCTAYLRNAALYARLWSASDCLNHSSATDTHNWRHRLSEFAGSEDPKEAN